MLFIYEGAKPSSVLIMDIYKNDVKSPSHRSILASDLLIATVSVGSVVLVILIVGSLQVRIRYIRVGSKMRRAEGTPVGTSIRAGAVSRINGVRPMVVSAVGVVGDEANEL